MKKFAQLSLIGLACSALYLYGWPAPNLFYAAAVLFHTGLGLLFCAIGILLLRRVAGQNATYKVSACCLFIGGALGVVLVFSGSTRPFRPLVLAHILSCIAGVALLALWWLGQRQRQVLRWGAALAIVVAVAVLSIGAKLSRESWSKRYQINNPDVAPLSMDQEGDGPGGMFFPSSAQVAGTRQIPAKFFMESDACARCHQDIYKQWASSAHHFSSFNNQWYRKSIEYMQEVDGVKPSKWCAGCHDPALLYSGMMNTPIKEIVHRPEAQAGLGCMMCHSIVRVKSTMGQGDFMLEYPKLHELAATKNPVMRWLHDFSIYLNPEPHKRVFLKPFMRNQTPEFCSTCHKVHLDVPVNNYRWIRGFNEYDNWQASGVSGMGARSFYYPPHPQQCAECHMPSVQSKDAGNIDGKIHSHTFPGANTALPYANKDAHQMQVEESFLKDGNVSIDIFALSHAAPVKSAAGVSNELATTFAVGEEADVKSTPSETGTTAPVTAPLNEVGAVVQPGDNVRVDVVVRTKKVGHFFPGGTVDAYDTWVELKATDENGRPVFWSGSVEDGGKGPVEKGAHFYRSLQMDEHGNPINKRNAWATRAVVYVHLIPPGAADTVHYRLQIPKDASKKINLTARLCYRKFSWWNTYFSFAGRTDASANAPQTTTDYDDRHFTFTGDTSDVSGEVKQVPELPIITLASQSVDMIVAPKGTPAQQPQISLHKEDWQRWNDYGIGLLLQGDLKGAAAAFQKVTEADPQNPDGWVNLGRVAVQEGDMESARRVLEKALSLSPKLARANFFYARVLRSNGDYDGAISRLKDVIEQYPKDRVVRNELGRILFLERKYGEAILQLREAIAIDPEDLQANYNLMLCYKGMGKNALADEYQKRYLRFKADEASQALTGAFRRLHPEDNNERQSIHEHVSAPIPKASQASVARSATPHASGR